MGSRDERNESLRVRRRVLVLVRVDCERGRGLDLLHGGHDRGKRRSRSAAKRDEEGRLDGRGRREERRMEDRRCVDHDGTWVLDAPSGMKGIWI